MGEQLTKLTDMLAEELAADRGELSKEQLTRLLRHLLQTRDIMYHTIPVLTADNEDGTTSAKKSLWLDYEPYRREQELKARIKELKEQLTNSPAL